MYIMLFLIFDQVAKLVVKAKLQPVSFISLIKNLISFQYVENRGAAFGIMNGRQTLLITITAIFVIIFFIYYVKKVRPQNKKLLNIAVELVLAGAIGNLIDRVVRGYVIDFIKLEFIDFPVFNIADICIDVGIVIILVYILYAKDKSK